MSINGVTYTFVRDSSGYDIFANGAWVGWSAGNITDAKNTVRDWTRSA